MPSFDDDPDELYRVCSGNRESLMEDDIDHVLDLAQELEREQDDDAH